MKMKPTELTKRGFDSVDELLAAYDALKAATRWIPVTERLPEESGMYLTCSMGKGVEFYGDGVTSYAYSAKYRWWNCRDWFEPEFAERHAIDDVTHWQALPAPPGEVQT